MKIVDGVEVFPYDYCYECDNLDTTSWGLCCMLDEHNACPYTINNQGEILPELRAYCDLYRPDSEKEVMAEPCCMYCVHRQQCAEESNPATKYKSNYESMNFFIVGEMENAI